MRGKAIYRRLWYRSLAASSDTSSVIVDRSLLPTAVDIQTNVRRMTNAVHKFSDQNPSHLLVKSLHSIATISCRDTTQSQIDNLTLLMRAIVNHHLQDMADEKKADCTAKIFSTVPCLTIRPLIMLLVK
jgi:hypothetical protein